MCKRYYVEVRGLDPDKGEQQLEQVGITPDAILVIDPDDIDQRDCVVAAIKQVTGVGMDAIREHNREHNAVAARTLYIHYCMMRGDNIGRLCTATARDRPRIIRYLRDYDTRMYGDREFRNASNRIQKILDADPAWEPAQFERPVSPRKRRRKRGRKRRRRIIPVPKQKPAQDKRQLEIEW